MYSPVTMGNDEDSLRLQLEADIHHANALAAAIPRAKSGTRVQMKLVYNQLAPLFLFFLQWIHCSCTFFLPTYLNLFHIMVYKVYADGRTKNISTRGRKATITQFYAVILPSLERLHHDNNNGGDLLHAMKTERIEEDDREDECGICLEPCTRMVLPNCCHSMCINCYRDWNTRSESCPFCRGNIKRIMSTDLWVLTCSGEIIDADMVTKEDLSRFYLYMNKLPKVSPDDALFSMYYEYLI